MGHTFTDNRHGLIAIAMATSAYGFAEREAAKAMINDAAQVSEPAGGDHIGHRQGL